MAAKKKGGDGSPAVVGSVRFGGKVYGPDDRDALQAAMKDAGVDEVRGFGVDSTDRSHKVLGRSDTRRGEIAARSEQARLEAQGQQKKAAGADAVNELLETGVSDLAAALDGISDRKTIQSAKRKDGRVSAGPLYQARLDALKAEESDEGEEE